MAYIAFDACSVDVSGQTRRGAKATCGHCSATEALPINSMRSHGQDDDLMERHAAKKFEAVGWKIGRSPNQNRCPDCFKAIKISSLQKKASNMTNVTRIKDEPQPTEPRAMSRDERRIIFEKVNEVYVSDKVGYSENWSDEKVASDLGVARAWVSALREEYFGPDVNENHGKATEEAKAFLIELNALQDNITQQVTTLFARAQEVKKTIEKLLEK